MRRVRQRDTGAELVVRKLLHGLGARYRVCPGDLPGRPDVANRRWRWCVLVHGCFWHGHRACRRATLPTKNAPFWREKIRTNIVRDRRHIRALRALGYTVLVAWECELTNPDKLRRRFDSLLRDARGGVRR
jgi:DNA mismatch endonuclease Vsr